MQYILGKFAFQGYLFSRICDNHMGELDNSTNCSYSSKNSDSGLELSMNIFLYCICILFHDDLYIPLGF